jgi:iron complex outermembrane recepter protein
MNSSFKRSLTKSCANAHDNCWAAIAAVGVLSVVALPSYAADQPVVAQNGTASQSGAANQGDSLQEIVVTAQFRQEKLQDVPIAITALNSAAMDARNMTNLVDIANSAPNVTMFESSAAFGKTNAAFIRGIGQGDFNLASSEPGVGIYIDDVYFATTLGSAFDLYDLDRVEVLRGPQGTLQGKNSIGGAINLVSKKPTGDGSGYVDVTLGDFSRRDFKAAYDMSIIPDSLFLRVSAFEQYRTGYVTRVNYGCANPQPPANPTSGGITTNAQGYTVNTAAPQYLQGNSPAALGAGCNEGTEGGIDVRGARGQLRWLINDKMENNFTAYVVDDNSEAAAETLVVTVPSQIAAFNATLLAKYGQQFDNRFLTNNFYTSYANFYDLNLQEAIPDTDSMHQWGFSDVYDWDFAEHAHFKSITAFLGYWTDFSDDQSASPLPLAWAYNLVDHQQFTQEFRLTGNAFDQLDWATGAFYYRGESTNRGQINVAIDGLNFYQNSPLLDHNLAVFGQVTEHFTDQFSVTAGARETHEDKEYTYQSFFGRLGPYTVNYSHTDWKVDADYKVTPDVMVYVSASTGFRGGGFNPRPFAADQINSFQPEKLLEYELGTKTQWFDHKVTFNADVFYGDYKNLQFQTQLIQGGIPYAGISNIGAATIYGYEVELEARPVGGLAVNSSIGFTGFKYKDLGDSVGCGGFADPTAAAAAGQCIAGNPGYSDYPTGQPKLKANIGVAYEFPIPGGSRITPRLDATYQSKVFSDDVNNTPDAIIASRTLLNGRIQWESADGKWSVAGLGTNLTNKEYYISLFDLRAFGEGMETGQPGAPREWAVNLHYKF